MSDMNQEPKRTVDEMIDGLEVQRELRATMRKVWLWALVASGLLFVATVASLLAVVITALL